LILGNKFEQLEREYLEEVIPIEELNKKITNIITNTSEQLAKRGTKNNHQTKISQNAMKLIQKRNNMLHESKTWTSGQRIEYSELNKTIKKKTRTEVRSFNTDMTKRIIEETNSTKAANKFLMQGSKTIIAMKRQDGTITHNKTEILSLATNFYRDQLSTSSK